jgi:hypothetical protein
MKKRLLFLALFGAMLCGSAGAMELESPKKKRKTSHELKIFQEGFYGLYWDPYYREYTLKLYPMINHDHYGKLKDISKLPLDVVVCGICDFFTAQELFKILCVCKWLHNAVLTNLQKIKLVTLGSKCIAVINNCSDDRSYKKIYENINKFERFKIVFNGLDLKKFSFALLNNFEEIDMHRCKHPNFKGIKEIKGLKKIFFFGMDLASFSFEPYKNLEEVGVEECNRVSLEHLKKNKKLKNIKLKETRINEKKLSFEPLENLEEIFISELSVDFKDIEKNKGLKKIVLYEIDGLATLPFGFLKNLRMLDISKCKEKEALRAIEKCENLEIIFFYLMDLSEFRFGPSFKNLKSISIDFCFNVNLDGIEESIKLEKISFSEIDLTGFPFGSFKHLKEILLHEGINGLSNEEVADLRRRGVKVR